MADDAPFLPGLSPVGGKPVQVTFDAGRLTSDGGILLLAEIERHLGIAERLARCLEDPPRPIALKRMMAAMIELFCDSFEDVPRRIVLDIDDTEDRVHGGQQLSLFHAHYDSRCFLPMHIYEATSGKPVAVILRPGKTPGGAEVALVLRHIVKAIRRRWPRVDILVRGDSHYARPEAMTWCEQNRVGYIFGLAGNPVLLTRVAALAEEAAVRRIEGEAEK